MSTNSTIFEQLTLMGSKTTAWNKFSSTMTSAIICLATNQKFNFSKYIFESMVRNLDNLSGKFLMYPRYKTNLNWCGRKPKRKDTQVPQPSGPTDIVTDKVVHKELGDSLVRAATTAYSLEVDQDNGGGPRCQETIGYTIAQTRFENVSKLSNDLLLAREVLDLENTKTTQANEIASLKRKVKKLEQKKRSRTHRLKRLRKVSFTARVESSGDDESLDYANNEMFDVGTMTGDEVFIKQEVVAKDVNLIVDEVTLAQALAALKSVKSKVKGDVIEETSVRVSAASASNKG
ncbi:hypothetical protein Tco_0588833 [Tanacetum coccineum]